MAEALMTPESSMKDLVAAMLLCLKLLSLYSSTPWHAIFAFQIPGIGTIVQMHFNNSSPLDEYPASMWIFIICSLFYCFAFGYHMKCQTCTPIDTGSLDYCVKVAFISGSLAYAALISVLVSHSLQPFVYFVWLMLLFIYFAHKKVAEIGEHMVSNLYEQWRRTKSGDVPAISGG